MSGKWGGKGGDALQRRKSRRAIIALCAMATLATCVAVTANRTDVAQAEASGIYVTIVVDGSERHVRTTQTTISATLKEAGVEIGPTDRVYPSIEEKPVKNMRIKVSRMVEKVVLQEEPIAFATRRQPTNKLRIGLTQMASKGEPGLKRLYYKVRYVDGVPEKRELTRAEVVVEPKDKIILIGDKGAGISRGSFSSRRAMTMHATAYDPGPKSCGKNATGRTCTGMKAGYGVVAVDPRVISLGTNLYIEGYGYAIAGDKGRAIKGYRIDLGFDTYSTAKKFGRKQVKVYVLE
jgi:3D (Asp-Asp-Asp) domain-containing protein